MKRKINKNIWTTGELGETTKEQSLLIKTENGNVIITGCAHPGLDNIINSLKNLGNISTIIGGFHDSNIKELKDLQIVIPCHCTQKKELIEKQNPESFRECKVGSIFKF